RLDPPPGRRHVAAPPGAREHALLRTAMITPAAVLTAVGEALRAAKDQLNEADSAAGDGDLGITADTIGRTLIDLAPELSDLGPAAAMRRLGTEIGSRAPSTFGTLLSMGLIGAARAEAGLDAPDAS